MKLIVREIFQQPNGYWWAWSFVKEGACFSLHTKDKAEAQIKYEGFLATYRKAFKT